MHSFPWALRGVLAVLPLIACSSASVGGEVTDDVGSSHQAASPTPSFDRYVGTYATFTKTVTTAETALGSIRPVSSAFGLAEIRKGAQGYEMVERACHVESEGTGPTITIPDAFPQSLGATVAPVVFSESAGGGIHLSRKETVSVAGAKLDKPTSDPLPTQANDSRVYDQDGDGKPGVTAHARVRAFFEISGEIYMVQRVRTATETDLDGKGGFRGKSVTTSTEQVILDASNSLLKVNVPSKPEPSAPETEARYVPVAAGLDCKALLAQRGTLFAP